MYVLEITSLVGIALLALIDDKFMRFLFAFTIFGFFKLHHKRTQNQAVILTEVRIFLRVFMETKSKLSDSFGTY